MRSPSSPPSWRSSRRARRSEPTRLESTAAGGHTDLDQGPDADAWHPHRARLVDRSRLGARRGCAGCRAVVCGRGGHAGQDQHAGAGLEGRLGQPRVRSLVQPWNLAKTPGGSSGGAAAAVAAGLGPLAQGSDGAGSIRIPAAFCGIFGFKPSFGLVPQYPPSAVGDLSHLGPMTRTVRDAAMMLNAMAGADARDRLSWSSGIDYTRDLDAGVRGLRVAWSPTLGYARVASDVLENTERAAMAFRELGCEVEQSIPGFPTRRTILDVMWSAAMAGYFAGGSMRSAICSIRDCWRWSSARRRYRPRTWRTRCNSATPTTRECASSWIALRSAVDPDVASDGLHGGPGRAGWLAARRRWRRSTGPRSRFRSI